jgi:YesN/AraC family two-component response regulator
MTVRVVVADDNELLRAGLVTVLASDAGLEVVGEAPDGPAAVRLAHDLQPDVVLMDVEMPGETASRPSPGSARSLPPCAAWC